MPNPLRRFLIGLPLLALGVAACGGSSAKQAPDPASVVPASTPLYASAIVRPQRALKSDAVADARALTGEAEPFAALLGVLQAGGAGGHASRGEVEAWLGERAGLFITHLSVPTISGPAEVPALLTRALSGQLFATTAGGGRGEGALVLDVTDTTKAHAFVAGAPGARRATFDGVQYWVAPSGEAYALVDNFVVLGSESGLKEVIAVSRGAPALDGHATYTSLRDSAAKEGVIANVYAQAGAFLHSTQAAAGSASQLFSLVRALAPSGAVYVSLAPQSHQVRVDIDVSSGSQPQSPSASENEQAAIAQQTFQALPEDSWFALRLTDFGAFAERALALASSPGGGAVVHELLGSLGGSTGSLLGSIGPSLERVLATLVAKRALVDHELLTWMGPAGLFVSGSSLAEFNAAAVINPKEASRAREAVAKLPAILAGSGATVVATTVPGAETAALVKLTGLPVPVQVGTGDGKFVVGLGLSPLSAALMPSGTLGSSSAYQAAVQALGEGIQPALMLNVPTLLSFANVLGLGSGGTLAKVIPYLRPLTTVTGGTKQLGNMSRTRILLGLD